MRLGWGIPTRLNTTFRLELLDKASAQEAMQGPARSQGVSLTDEASAMEWAGHRPLMDEGHDDNLKITRAADLPLAAYYLQTQAG